MTKMQMTMILTTRIMRSLYTIFIPIAFLISSTGCSENTEIENTARAVFYRTFKDTDTTYIVGDEIVGEATFSQKEGEVVFMHLELRNLSPNSIHAVHIHKGTCDAPSVHWNGQEQGKQCFVESLGKRWAKPFLGDIGNVSVAYDGSGVFNMETDLWSLGTGNANDIKGLVIFVHETFQDFDKECFDGHDHTHRA